MIGRHYGWWMWLVSLVCLAGAGCAGGGGGGGGGGGKQVPRQMRPPRLPPPVPPRVDTPVPAGLRTQARAEMNRAAESSVALTRAHALELMREADPEDAPPHVTRGLEDKDPVVRFAAALAAGELRVPGTHDRLRQLALEDRDPSVQVAARFALHRLGDPSLSHDLERTARSDDPRTRADTALVLGLMQEPSALNVLRSMRNDPDVTVRLQVAEAMWRLGDQDALVPLVGGTVSLYPDDQMTALMGLAAGGDMRVIEHLRGALTSDYEGISLVAARAMGKLGSDEGYGVALRGAKINDAKIRLLAALALGAIGRPDAQDVLATLMRDPNPDLRLAAAAAILELK